MKGKLLQKTTALILVLCMTMVNFIFVATNIVYAVSESQVSIESGKITFDAYFKDANGNKIYTKEANISEGATLYAKIKLQSGILKDAKITINNANFKLPEIVNSPYVAGVNNATKEIKFIELDGSYVNDIELEIPVTFEKQSTIDVGYFDMENGITLSGEYKASETFKSTTATINTNLKWKEDDSSKALPHVEYKQEKAIKDGNKALIQEKLTVKGGLLPRLEDQLNVTIPKINNKEPDTVTLLINGAKVNLSPNNITTGENAVLQYTNTFKNGDTINWGTGTDTYTIIYIYEDVENIESVTACTRNIQTAQVKLSVLNTKLVDDTVRLPRESKGPMTIKFNAGNIVSAEATSVSKEVYKGFMYANASNETTYTEKYNVEISDKTDINKVELKLEKDKFVHAELVEDKIKETNIQDTNKQTVYKTIKVDWDSASKVLGSDGTIKIRDGSGNQTEINASSEKEVQLNSHYITITTSKPVNEGTIAITAQKAIIGDAGLSKETIQNINAIKTEIKVTTNKDENGSIAEVYTKLKEPTTKPAQLTITNGYILSTKNVNDVEFQVKLATGTPDTYLFKQPTITLQLPEDVSKIANVSAKALFAEKNELQIDQTKITVDGNKLIIPIEGEQTVFDNQTVGGIVVTINAQLTVNGTVPEGTELPVKKAEKVTMSYTNENAATQPEPVSADVIIDIQKQETTQPAEQQPTNQDPTLEEETPQELGPAVEEKTDNMQVTMSAVSAGVELKDGDQINAGQTVTYTYKISNKSNNDMQKVNFKAVHEGANVFASTKVEREVPIYLEGTEKYENYTFIREQVGDSEYKVSDFSIPKKGTIVLTYQVRVKEDAQKLDTTAEITAENNEKVELKMTNTVKNTAALKLSLESNESKEYPNQLGSIVGLTLKIKNTSNEQLTKIPVNIRVPEEYKILEIYSMDVEEDDESDSKNYTVTKKQDNSLSFEVNSLASGATKELIVPIQVVKYTENKKQKINFTSTVDGTTYYSNYVETSLIEKKESKVDVTLTSNKNGSIKTGDTLVYNIAVKNTGKTTDGITITDSVPSVAQIKKASYTIGKETTEITASEDNSIYTKIVLEPGQQANITIETEVDETRTGKDTITNTVEVIGTLLSEPVEKEITHTLETNASQKDAEDNQDDPQQDIPSDDPTIPGIITTKNSISGIVWVDANKNGIREGSEKTLEGITARLVNTKTNKFVTDENGNKLEVRTNSNGVYSFENIEEGKYMVVFTFDNLKYRNTLYNASAATETTNSDIITGTISTDNNSKTYAMTNELVLTNKSLEHIDAGFIENEIFDLKINKYISKVTIQNTAGTVVKQYNKEQLAKVEIDAKLLASSTVLVEYTLEITNEGELAGYANEIVDYMPKDMSFNSEINKNWYKSTDGNVHTTALSKEIIQPGETKQVVLTLTKAMTENNTGVTTNKAEIAKSSNELSIPDKDTADNMSSAEIIVSIRTGIEVSIGIIIAIIAMTTTGIIVYTKKRKEANHE
ncbi:MAG: DUF11 domain-containing protein [Clostridia bacterium]|nr:DUF11 domain-containing protein [Clostridia bacterium]